MLFPTLTRPEFKRINQIMVTEWTRVFETHFGDEVIMGRAQEVPAGQVWTLEASICVGDNATVERELFSFTFPANEYENKTLDRSKFYSINDALSDELATLMEGPHFEPVRRLLAEEVYQPDKAERDDYVVYHLTIWAFLKDSRGRHALGDGLLGFSVNSDNPDHFQIDGIDHGSAAAHFTYVPSVFLSHSSLDKSRIRTGIARELRNAGLRIWLDEAELRPGDSLVERLGQAIAACDTIVACLSEASVNSKWVQKELNVAGSLELEGVALKVVPVLLDDIQVPPFLSDKLHVDLRNKDKWLEGMGKLINAADARFWRMQDPMPFADAKALEQRLVHWKLPTLGEARLARTAMIYSELTGYNRAIWTCERSSSAGSQAVLEGIKKRRRNKGRKADCVFVPGKPDPA